MDRRRFALSLAVIPLMQLIPAAPHTRVLLPKDCCVRELLGHLKEIAHQGHYYDSVEFRLGDGRCLALDTSLTRRRVVEYDFTRGASVKPFFYTETSFLSSSVTPDAYYLFVCSLMYAAHPLFGSVKEMQTVDQLVYELPKRKTNLFSLWHHEAGRSLGSRLKGC